MITIAYNPNQPQC